MLGAVNTLRVINSFPLRALVLLGLLLFASPVAGQVFDSGPSDPALFDSVIDLPPAPDIAELSEVGGDGLTTQLNIFGGGSVEFGFDALAGSEVNIRDGDVGELFDAHSGSAVNISGGTVGNLFRALSGSEVNISGGDVGGQSTHSPAAS